jgi:hypothetical protein
MQMLGGRSGNQGGGQAGQGYGQGGDVGFDQSYDGGYGQSAQSHEKTAIWSCLYGQTFTLGATTVKAGWGLLGSGYFYSNFIEGDGGFFGAFSSSSSSNSKGDVPWTQETINLIQNTILIGDARSYD